MKVNVSVLPVRIFVKPIGHSTDVRYTRLILLNVWFIEKAALYGFATTVDVFVISLMYLLFAESK